MKKYINETEFLARHGRFELKFAVDRNTMSGLLARFRHFMRLDKNCNEKGFYINRSLYYDTAEFKDYHEYINGEKRRKKVRIRKYEINSQIVNLEIKHKLNKIIWKDKYKAPQTDTMRFVTSPDCWGKGTFNDERLLHLLLRKSYEPKCTVSYQRVALSDVIGAGVRVTFDYNIRTGGPEAFDREITPNDLRVLAPIIAIMELKFNRYLPTWCERVISDFNLSYTTYSKYAESVDRIFGNKHIIKR